MYAGGPRQTKIEDLDARLARHASSGAGALQDDVRRLQIAVHDPFRMSGVQRVGNLTANQQRVGDGQLPAPETVPDDQFSAAAQEVASRLWLALSVPRGSRAPLLDYDPELLDRRQRAIAEEWVVAVLSRGLDLEAFDGVERSRGRRA